MGEPLKDKRKSSVERRMIEELEKYFYFEEDIKSAVEWLKERLTSGIDKRLVDKAFPDLRLIKEE